MNESSKSSISDFLNNFPRIEIVDILKEIDEKINSLHTISSKDFLFFNDLLKIYYAQTKDLSGLNGQLISHLSKGISESTVQLQNKNQSQKDFIIEINGGINKLIELLSQAFSNFSLTIVPFNNYKQNLITLKYVLANLKLHLSYINLTNKDEFKKQLLGLDVELDSSLSKVETVSLNTNLLGEQLLSLKDKTNEIKANSSVELCDHILSLNKSLSRFSLEDYWSNEMIMNINSHTQMCFASMGEIITNLQYHDIIRQKMEHIQESQKELIKGIDNLEEVPQDSDALSQLAGFIVKIPEVTSVQVAQLLYTNKDYQTSLEKISNKLLEVSREMKLLNSIYTLAYQNTIKFNDKFLSEIFVSQNNFVDFLNQVKVKWEGIDTNVSVLMDNYTLLKQELQSMFDQEKEIRSEVRSLEKLIKQNGKDFSIELVSRLSQITAELQVNSNSLKNNLNAITSQMTGALHLFGKLKSDYMKMEISSEAIELMDSRLKQASNLAKGQSDHSLKISEEINSSLHKVEYYKYFKSTVEEIVAKLNLINGKIDYDSIEGAFDGGSEVLERMKEFYTMHSERAIHGEVAAKEDMDDAESNSNMDEDDVELF